MKKKIFLIMVMIIIIFIIFITITGKNKVGKQYTYLTVGNSRLSVEIAKTPAAIEQGLSGRKELCPSCGLLFVFPERQRYTFWMKQMYFDIDILWIDGGKVVDITYNAAKPPVAEFNAPRQIYQPKVPVDRVLEVNVGWAKAKGIKIGDAIFLDN